MLIYSGISPTESSTTTKPLSSTNTETTNTSADTITNLPLSSTSMTIDPTTDMVQGHMISASNSYPEASSSILGPAVGGVVGGLVVITIIIAVVVIALLFIKRGQKRLLKVNNRKESVQGFNSAVYDGKQNT